MLDIVEYPNAGLKTPTEAVQVFDRDLAKTIDEMVMAMYAGDGVGLAAPQVGLNKNMLVMDPSAGQSGNELRIIINPVIVETSEEMTTGEEGCLSIPGVKLAVPRHAWVTVKYLTLGKEGQNDVVQCKEAFIDWAAKIVQHEIDHLNGILMLDRVGPLQRQLALKNLRRSR